MPKQELPERPSLEYLKKRAKENLAELRRKDPKAKLADAQLAIARDYGFKSWRALKAEIDRRHQPTSDVFFEACRSGSVETMRKLLETDPSLVRARGPGEITGLHAAGPNLDAVRLLLSYGADPNAREKGDNAYPLHFVVGTGNVELVRALLDAGGDPIGEGDAHELEVIGWASCFGPTIPKEVVELLLERGARHHIFSAIAAHELETIRKVVNENPNALLRRLSRTENRQTALHYVIAPPDGLMGGGFRKGDHYDMLDLLIELGADLEATDDKGRTPLAVAMLRGDEEGMRRLKAAGAKVPKQPQGPSFDEQMRKAAKNVKKADGMISVPNVRAAVDWYISIGFQLEGEHEIDTNAAWAGVSLGGWFVMFVPGGTAGKRQAVSFWLRTESVDDLYQILKKRQMARSAAILRNEKSDIPEIRFIQDLHDAFYGEREFAIVDLNGYELHFVESIES